MIITEQLHKYLTDSSDLAGHPAVAFSSAQAVVDGVTVVDRNEARRAYLNRIGSKAIYVGRRRQTTSGRAVTIERVSNWSQYTLGSEINDTEDIIQISVWAKDPGGAREAEVIGELLRIAVSGYVGSWGDSVIQGCTVERKGSTVSAPTDGSDNWMHQFSFDIRVTHSQPAPVY